jgi:hypothetical protein
MYDRNLDDFDVVRLSRALRAAPEPRPMKLAGRIVFSVSLIVAPVVTFFLILGILRLINAF